jgi:PBP1b-binding outer membrane lipoprotein LpoB
MDMKKLLMIAGAALVLASCSNALDGEAKTDTTSMPVDTNLNRTTTNNHNTPEGTIVGDSTGRDSIFSQQ